MTTETIDCGGLTIEIATDEDAPDPRKECDHLGEMRCIHGKYKLGDQHDMDSDELIWCTQRPDVLALPLYLYDHSGITMSTAPFSCPWDSGQVGYILVTHENIKAEWGAVSPEILDKARACLEAEVVEYDHYLTGNVYGYMVKSAAGEILDSCWGYYGDPHKSGCVSDARAAVIHLRSQFTDNFQPKETT